MTKLDRPFEARRFTVEAPVMLQRVRLRLSREGKGAELTHLQQIDLVRRAIREAGWSFKKVSFGPAISVGVESLAEYCDVQLSSRIDLTNAKEKLAEHMTSGYGVMDLKSIPRFFPSLEESINVCQFEVTSQKLDGTRAQWDAFSASSEFVVVKKKSDKDVAINARPLVKQWKLEGPKLEILLRFGPGKTLKPERLVQAVCGWPEEICRVGTPPCELFVKRLQFYLEKDSGELLPI